MQPQQNDYISPDSLPLNEKSKELKAINITNKSDGKNPCKNPTKMGPNLDTEDKKPNFWAIDSRLNNEAKKVIGI